RAARRRGGTSTSPATSWSWPALHPRRRSFDERARQSRTVPRAPRRLRRSRRRRGAARADREERPAATLEARFGRRAGGARALRRPPARRADRRRHRQPLVRGRPRHPRRPDRGDRAAQGRNGAHLVGATQVRMAALKSDNRAPTPGELAAMKRHLARAMEQGAFGLSSALIYTPGTFAGTEELVELAKVAASYGGIYASHIRNESARLVPALEEAATIGEQARIPVEVWHFKSAGKPNWGRIGEGIRSEERRVG